MPKITPEREKEKIEEFVKSIMNKTRLLNSLWDEEKPKELKEPTKEADDKPPED